MTRMRTVSVLDFDGVVLTGVVAGVDRQERVSILRRAESRAPTLAAAVAEVVLALERPPSIGVVRTVEALAAVVTPPRARDRDEAERRVAAELIARRPRPAELPRLDVILEARGCLDRAQANRVLALRQVRRAAPRSDVVPVDFGVIACELGYVTVPEVEAALAAQRFLADDDGDWACGWTTSVSGDGRWWAAGLPVRRRDRWRRELRAHGLHLRAVYPRRLHEPDGLAAAGWIDVARHAVGRGGPAAAIPARDPSAKGLRRVGNWLSEHLPAVRPAPHAPRWS